MANPQIVNTLRTKRGELESLIAAYEKKIEAARFALMHVNATLRLFELNAETEVFPFTWVYPACLSAARFSGYEVAFITEI